MIEMVQGDRQIPGILGIILRREIGKGRTGMDRRTIIQEQNLPGRILEIVMGIETGIEVDMSREVELLEEEIPEILGRVGTRKIGGEVLLGDKTLEIETEMGIETTSTGLGMATGIEIEVIESPL